MLQCVYLKIHKEQIIIWHQKHWHLEFQAKLKTKFNTLLIRNHKKKSNTLLA